MIWHSITHMCDILTAYAKIGIFLIQMFWMCLLSFFSFTEKYERLQICRTMCYKKCVGKWDVTFNERNPISQFDSCILAHWSLCFIYFVIPIIHWSLSLWSLWSLWSTDAYHFWSLWVILMVCWSLSLWSLGSLWFFWLIPGPQILLAQRAAN